MKKILMIAIVLMTTMHVNAQNEEGEWSFMPKVGLGIADMTGKLLDDNSYTLKPIFSLVAGVEAEYAATEQLSIATGFMYSTQGSKAQGAHKYEINMDYINIPLTFMYYPIPNCGLALKTGAQIGFTVRKKLKVDGARIDLDHAESMAKALGEPTAFNKADVSIPFGISYEFMSFVLDARYNLGLTNIFKNDPENCKNSVWQFTIGYKLGFTN